ncbi:hypothetical protein CHS0354_015145 [Potamilus streckersoni]|uniref:Uncharacterized protein n=1 Tax=Potamilus streckersoni TaxID=2493646 RepID=A0AAE0SD43_9BIVA|nr:hypothetical protein CHS0354_015145 [Potamilus streckersoni]
MDARKTNNLYSKMRKITPSQDNETMQLMPLFQEYIYRNLPNININQGNTPKEPRGHKKTTATTTTTTRNKKITNISQQPHSKISATWYQNNRNSTNAAQRHVQNDKAKKQLHRHLMQHHKPSGQVSGNNTKSSYKSYSQMKKSNICNIDSMQQKKLNTTTTQSNTATTGYEHKRQEKICPNTGFKAVLELADIQARKTTTYIESDL